MTTERKSSLSSRRMRKLGSSLLAITCISCCFLLGCRPPPLLSYPWFWDYTRTKPKDADLVGSYGLLKLRLSSALARSVREKEPVITLKADHTVIFTDIPEFDGFGDELVCRLSGSANWELNGLLNSTDWSVEFRNYRPALGSATPECNLKNTTWSISVLSQHAPYRLYATVGDPDSDTGVEFKRK
jgi:hypothetical protein